MTRGSIFRCHEFTDLTTNAQSGGKYLNGMDLTITFNGDGTLTVKEGAGAPTRVPLSTYAPNGALVVNGGNIRIKGKFTGQLTILAQSGGVGNKGKVYLDSSVTYVNNPMSGPSSDLLGICAEDSVVITNNLNNRSGIDVQASVFSLNKGMGAEQYASGSPRGSIRLLGGISQQQRAAVGTIDGSGNVITGYSKSYRYDDRLMNQSPPYFPTTGSYEILSWYKRRQPFPSNTSSMRPLSFNRYVDPSENTPSNANNDEGQRQNGDPKHQRVEFSKGDNSIHKMPNVVPRCCDDESEGVGCIDVPDTDQQLWSEDAQAEQSEPILCQES